MDLNDHVNSLPNARPAASARYRYHFAPPPEARFLPEFGLNSATTDKRAEVVGEYGLSNTPLRAISAFEMGTTKSVASVCGFRVWLVGWGIQNIID